MVLKKFRWSKVYESSEEELLGFLSERHINAECVVPSTLDEPDQRTSSQDSTLWCAEGSMVVCVMGKSITLQPGDALRLPPNAAYEVRAGISGYTYYESTTSEPR
jgi:mannose-6-phosphate isomerase-like protein (cupin superfamily)